MQPDDKFMYALRDQLPDDFAEDLYLRLMKQEQLDMQIARMTPQAAIYRPKTSPIIGLVAAFSAALLCGLIFTLAPRSPSSLMDQPALSLHDAVPITVDNVRGLQPITSVGAGTAESIAWLPETDTMAVAGSTGIHLHAPDSPAQLFGGQEIATGDILYSTDGALLAGVRDDGVYIWDSQTAAVVNRIESSGVDVRLIDFNLDSTQIAAIIYECMPDQCSGVTAEVVKLGSEIGREIYTFGYECADNCPVTKLTIWDVQTGAIQKSVDVGLHAKVRLDGNFTWFASYEIGVFTFLHLLNGTAYDFSYDENYISDFDFSRDGTRLVVAEYGESIKVFYPDHLSRMGPYPFVYQIVDTFLPTSIGTSVRFLPGSYDLFVSDFQTYMGVFSGDNYSPIAEKRLTQPFAVQQFILHKTAAWVAGLARGIIRVWDRETGELISNDATYSSPFSKILFSPDDKWLVGLGYDGDARKWDMTSKDLIESSLLNADQETFEIIRSGAFIGLDMIGLHTANLNGLGRIRIFDLVTGNYRFTSQSIRDVPNFGVTEAGILLSLKSNGVIYGASPDSRARDQITQLEDVDSFDLERDVSFSPVFSPDGSKVVANVCLQKISSTLTTADLCGKSEFRVWDTQTGQHLATLAGGVYYSIPARTFSPDGKIFAVSQCQILAHLQAGAFMGDKCEGAHILLWDLSNLPQTSEPIQPIVTLVDPDGILTNNLAFTPNSTAENLLMAGVNSKQLKFWQINAITGESALLNAIDHPAFSLEFNHGGNWLAVGGAGKLEIWGTDRSVATSTAP